MRLDGKPSYRGGAARTTLGNSDIGVGVHSSGAARTTLGNSDIGVGVHSSGAARTTLSNPDIGTGLHSSDAGRITRMGLPSSATNPLPSDYGFIAAPTTTKLQHGPVIPNPKETPHHG